MSWLRIAAAVFLILWALNTWLAYRVSDKGYSVGNGPLESILLGFVKSLVEFMILAALAFLVTVLLSS